MKVPLELEWMKTDLIDLNRKIQCLKKINTDSKINEYILYIENKVVSLIKCMNEVGVR